MGSQLDFCSTLKKNNLLETSTVSRYNIQLIKCNCLRKRGQQGNRSHTLEGFPLFVEWLFVAYLLPSLSLSLTLLA